MEGNGGSWDISSKNYNFLCSDHFEDSPVVRASGTSARILKSGCVPTLVKKTVLPDKGCKSSAPKILQANCCDLVTDSQFHRNQLVFVEKSSVILVKVGAARELGKFQSTMPSMMLVNKVELDFAITKRYKSAIRNSVCLAGLSLIGCHEASG